MDDKERYIKLLRSTRREGILKLLTMMEIEGFYQSPCSSTHHLNVPGGLVKHSLNVYDCMVKLKDAFLTEYDGITDYIDDDNIILVSLLHDLGKMGDHGKPGYLQNILKDGKQSDKKPYVTNADLLYVPHEIRSIAIAERYINLTEEEEFAILQHNGMYGDLKYALKDKETPLQMLLHFADMWASRVIEIEKEEKEAE